jgi:hypothetical protein
VLAECVRIYDLLRETKPADFKHLPRKDMGGSLPDPSGSGDMICGLEAERRVWGLAQQALEQSDAVGTLETKRVYRALSQIIVDRFVKEQMPVDTRQVDKALSAAVRAAKHDRQDIVHFIPCRLMYAGKPNSFEIGPVPFQTRSTFNEGMATHFESYVRNDSEPFRIELNKGLLADARHYYDGFTWVAKVKVLNCDEETSGKRAELAVLGAVNVLHILFGSYHTERMYVAGPRMADDRRACLILDSSGELHVSVSSSATSAVGFQEGWDTLLKDEGAAFALRGAAKALESFVNPAIKRPMGMRLADAAAWFGDAVREASPAAQIVKGVTGLEALVMTDEQKEIASTLSARAAAIAYHPQENKSFLALESELGEAYDKRSQLVHGSLSPFDPEVDEYAPACLHLVEQVICAGLILFESQGLLETPATTKELGRGFDKIVEWAKAHSANRDGTS